MSHVAKFKGDKKPRHGEPVQVKVDDAAAEAALLRMMGPCKEKGRMAEEDAADASQQGPPPAPAAASGAAASPAKADKPRDTTPNRAREGTSKPGTPNKSRTGAAASPSPARARGGSGGGA